MKNYLRKKFNRTLPLMRQETTAANEDRHPGYNVRRRVSFKNAILEALQTRGYVPEKFYIRSTANYTKDHSERDASHGGNDRDVVEEELTNIPGLKSYILPMETLKYATHTAILGNTDGLHSLDNCCS